MKLTFGLAEADVPQQFHKRLQAVSVLSRHVVQEEALRNPASSKTTAFYVCWLSYACE